MSFQRADGMSYAPQGKPAPVVKPGEFKFAAMHLDHGHIGGMCNGLTEAGAELVAVYDPDPAKVEALVKRFPGAQAARSADEVLQRDDVRLVAAAAVTSERGPLGCRVMEHGKDYFTDKAPLTTLDQLAEARRIQAEVAFARGENFLQNFLRLLGDPGRRVEVHFLEPVAPVAGGRRGMADTARRRIAAVLGADGVGEAPASEPGQARS